MTQAGTIRDGFKSLRPIAKLLIVALCLVILFDVVLLGISAQRIDMANRMLSGGTYTAREVSRSDSAAALVEFLQLLAFVTANIVFMIWTYRASRNLRPLGSFGQTYSPGWAVGWFFIPIANLAMPLMIVTEIWKASSPNHGVGRVWRSNEVSWAVPGWWASVVAAGLLLIPFMLMSGSESADGLLKDSWMTVIGNLIEIGGAALFILVVQGITSRQENRSHNVSALQQ